MGRVKLKIKRLESTSNRQVTYSKRRNGILKKARELSILCDIDIALLMFSPTGRATLFHGERSNIEEIITKFSQLTPQERTKRKLESLEALKKTFKKLDHDVNIQEFLGGNNDSVEALTNQVALLQLRITEVHRRLSYWSNTDKIDNIEHLSQLEDSLRGSLDSIRLHKENFGKNPLMSLDCTDCTNQFQNGMSLPLVMGSVQEAQPLPWRPNNEHQHHFMLPCESNFLPHREMNNDAPGQAYPGFYCQSHQAEIGNTGQADNVGQENSALNGSNPNGCISLQLHDQYSYQPYGGVSLQNDKNLKPEMDMALQGNPSAYQANGNFQLPQPTYDNGTHAWAPASNACSVSIFDETSYNQQHNGLS